MFPTEPDAFTDLDDHFYRVRRVVMGILIALVFVQWSYLIYETSLSAVLGNTRSVIMTLVLLALMFAGLIWKNDKLNIAVLATLNLRYLTIYLIL